MFPCHLSFLRFYTRMDSFFLTNRTVLFSTLQLILKWIFKCWLLLKKRNSIHPMTFQNDEFKVSTNICKTNSENKKHICLIFKNIKSIHSRKGIKRRLRRLWPKYCKMLLDISKGSIFPLSLSLCQHSLSNKELIHVWPFSIAGP